MTKTQTKPLRAREGRTDLDITHNGQDLTFVHPSYRPNTYAIVKEAIESAGLKTPTMAESASLVHTAFNSDDKYSNEIKGTMKDRYLWAFTGTLYVPNRGAYIQDNPQISNGMPYMDSSELERKLEAKDPSVRFVPFGFDIESMSPMQLGKNPYVIALAGEEGAEKLAEVADMFKQKPYLWSFESVDEPLTRVSALSSDWGFDRGLYVDGNNRGDDRGGHAFGGRSAREKK
jgi:hypothetical protein